MSGADVSNYYYSVHCDDEYNLIYLQSMAKHIHFQNRNRRGRRGSHIDGLIIRRSDATLCTAV